MTSWREFLVEHAKFPFPVPQKCIDDSDSTTDISPVEVGLLAPEWKAHYAVQDELLLKKLCETLDDILRDKYLPGSDEDRLLSSFGRRLREFETWNWSINDCEAQSRMLLYSDVFTAAKLCLLTYGEYAFRIYMGDHGMNREGYPDVDFIGMVGDKPVVLTEAQSPSVMTMAGNLLPVNGIKLTWARGQPFIAQLLQKAALHLGLRKMEWMFLSCLNYWIICRLVRRDDGKTFLAYSPVSSIENSSEPFRAFLGAVLSVQNGIPVQTSTIDPEMKLDDITDHGPFPDNDIGLTNVSSKVPTTTIHSRTSTSGHAMDPGLLITSSLPHFPESSQVWVPLQPLPNDTHALPLCTKNGNVKQRLWLTQFIGFGSTGHVWKCRFDDDDTSYAIKVVEPLQGSDEDIVEHQERSYNEAKVERFYNEAKVYSILEQAYKSGKLRDRITPRFYGAFEGDGTYALILELCDDTLQSWEGLSISERKHIYGLARDLHRVGIVHGDLEPRNVARVPGGGFLLIDFSESVRKHNCKDILANRPSTRVRRHSCHELLWLRHAFKCVEERERAHTTGETHESHDLC